jgi:hypothetical protein
MVYVDQIFSADPAIHADSNPRAMQAARWGTRWCHMWADTPEDIDELHAIAQKIGLRRAYFQERRGPEYPHHERFPHYDLIPSKRKLAILSGAKERPLIDWLRQFVVNKPMQTKV